MIKKLFSRLLFAVSFVCFLSPSMLVGMKSNGQHDKKSEEQKGILAPLWDLPDDIWLNIIFCMLLGDKSEKTIDGKALKTMALVSRRMNNLVSHIYEDVLPGLQSHFIMSKYKREAPRASIELLILGGEMLEKNGVGRDKFLALIIQKGYRTLDCLMPAYGLTNDDKVIDDGHTGRVVKSGKEPTAVKLFLEGQIHRLLDEFSDEIDKNEELAKEWDNGLLRGYQSRIMRIMNVSSDYWCGEISFPKIEEILKKLSKIACAEDLAKDL